MLPPEDVLQLIYRKVFDGVLREMVASHPVVYLSIIQPAGPWRNAPWFVRQMMSREPAGLKDQATRRMFRFVLEALERAPRNKDELCPAFCISCSTRDGLRTWVTHPDLQELGYFSMDDGAAKAELEIRAPCPCHLLLS